MNLPEPTAVHPALQLLLQTTAICSNINKQLDMQLSVHGLSFTEFMVLHQLYQAPQQTMRRLDLAQAIGLSASGVTRLLNPLEKTHWVEKEQNSRDARVSLVKLSSIGTELYLDALRSSQQAADHITGGCTDKQLTTLLELLAKLR